jgi:hypothetical protein
VGTASRTSWNTPRENWTQRVEKGRSSSFLCSPCDLVFRSFRFGCGRHRAHDRTRIEQQRPSRILCVSRPSRA